MDSDNNGNRNNNDNNNNTPSPRRNPGNHSTARVIMLYVAVIAVVTLMIVFFVSPWKNNNSDKDIVVNNNDIVKVVDGNGDPVLDADGHQLYEGKLADILLNEGVIKLQTQVVGTDKDVHTVAGYYNPAVVDAKGVKFDTAKRFYFSGRLEATAYESFKDLIQHRLSYKIDAEGYVTTAVNVDTEGNAIRYYNPNIYQTVVPSSNTWTSWLPLIIISAVVMLGLWFLLSRATKSMKNGMGGVNEVASSRARRETNTRIRFADVAGCDEVKAELVELVDYFKNAAKYTRLGAKLPKGVLLVGPPGTGKTLLAKAVAGEAQVPFYSISGSDFVEMYVGVGASRVRDMFKTAKKNSPCLIFIDEIDAVGRQRGAGLGGGNDEREQTLNQLLVEMDGFEDNSGIIIIAATNRADVLDPALTRAGRFDRQITVDLPDKEGREAIFKVHARNKKIAKDVDFGQIASRTTGFSGADIANIINDAAILAVRANRELVTTKDIDEAIDRSIAGPAKSNRSMLDIEKKQVAYHESGHAIVGLFLPNSDKVQKVTIVPRGRTGGHVMMTPEQDRFLLTKGELEARITGYLAGRTSEEIFFDDISTGASNDIEVATRLAKSMVTEYGMSSLGPIQYERPGGSVFLGRDYADAQQNYSTQIAYEIDTAVRAIIDECHEMARQLITAHKDDVVLMAETLLQVETLTADQIAYLLEHRELPPIDEHLRKEEEEKGEDAPLEGAEDSELFSKTTPMTEEAASVDLHELSYYGDSCAECDRFNDSLKKMMATNPQVVVLIAESRALKVKNYTPRGIKQIVTKFAAGRKYAFVLVTSELFDHLHMASSDLGQKIEDESGCPVLLLETSRQSINDFVQNIRSGN